MSDDIFDAEFEAAVDSYDEAAYVEWCEYDGAQQEWHINRMSEIVHKMAGDMIVLLADSDDLADEMRRLKAGFEAGWLERWAARFIARKHNQRRE